MDAILGMADIAENNWNGEEKRKTLKRKLQKLTCIRDDISSKLDNMESSNKKRNREVSNWLVEVERVDNEVRNLEVEMEESRWSMLWGRRVGKLTEEVEELITDSKFERGLVLEECETKGDLFIVPMLVGQAFQVNRAKIWLMTDQVSRIGIYGMERRYFQYNVLGDMFMVSYKYVPPIQPVGRGRYGIVCCARNANTKEEVAIKKIVDAFNNTIDAMRTLHEIKLLCHMDHENVLNFMTTLVAYSTISPRELEDMLPFPLFFFSNKLNQLTDPTNLQIVKIKDIIPPPEKEKYNDVYIAYELMDTDLHQIIRSSQNLTDNHCQYFLYQLLKGLKYIHSANVLHRDLKPSNLLLNANCDLKICEFGLARTTSESDFTTECIVTRWYRAPEFLFNCSEYTTAIDIWSVGCIFMEILRRKPLFPGKNYVQQLNLITQLLGTPEDSDIEFLINENSRKYFKQLPLFPKQPFSQIFPDVSPLALDLAERLLVFDPSKRITVEEALNHPYLVSLHGINEEPTCPSPFVFNFEQISLTEEDIKELILEESLNFNLDIVVE